MKRCPKCGESLDVSAFAIDNSKRDGLKTYCKACDNARSHAYYEAHRDEVIARVQAQREQLPEKLRRRSRGRLSSRRRSRRWWSSARKPVLRPLDAEARTSAGSSAATSSGWGSWSSACLAAWRSRSCLLRHRWQTRRYLSKRNVGPSARAAGALCRPGRRGRPIPSPAAGGGSLGDLVDRGRAVELLGDKFGDEPADERRDVSQTSCSSTATGRPRPTPRPGE